MLGYVKRLLGWKDAELIAFHCKVDEGYDLNLDVVKRSLEIDFNGTQIFRLAYDKEYRTYMAACEPQNARDRAEKSMLKLVRLLGVQDCVAQMPWQIWLYQSAGNCWESWKPPSLGMQVAHAKADDTDWKVDGENLKTAKVYLGFASETGEMDIIEQDPMPHRAPDGKIVPDQSGDAVKGYTRSHGSKETEDGVNDSWEKSEPSKPRKPAWLYVLGPPVQVNGVAGSNQLSKIVEMKLSTHRIS